MEHVRRVIVHDKPPILDPEVFLRPSNRLVLGVAGAALLVQFIALAQVLAGQGRAVTVFDGALKTDPKL